MHNVLKVLNVYHVYVNCWLIVMMIPKNLQDVVVVGSL